MDIYRTGKQLDDDAVSERSVHSLTGSQSGRSRGGSFRSRASASSINVLSIDSVDNGMPGLARSATRRHRRQASDTSARTFISLHSSDATGMEDSISLSGSLKQHSLSHTTVDEMTIFIDDLPKNVVCMFCSSVFSEPVIAKCGHTFCKACLLKLPPGGQCPAHKKTLVIPRHSLIPNLTVLDQIGELQVRCRHGCTWGDGDTPTPVVKDGGCPDVVKLCDRALHESACGFAPTRCPNSLDCGTILRRELAGHLKGCEKNPCPHSSRGCLFSGTREALSMHMQACKFETVKGFLDQSELQIQTLSAGLERKDGEIASLRGVVTELSDRLTTIECMLLERMDGLEALVEQLQESSEESNLAIGDVAEEIGRMQEQLDIAPGPAFEGALAESFKCRGTFVGHQGPVWALAVHNDLLFSGSSDETIKVWETRSATGFKCKKTMHRHNGIIHCMVVDNGKLYSGSSDRTIIVWDINTSELLDTLRGHDNPVCTISVANGMLFTGSLKCVRVWDIYSHELLGEICELNHWVRALTATPEFIYAGSYQTISVWSSKRAGPGGLQEAFDKGEEPRVLQTLSTSGGSVYSLCVTNKLILCGTFEHLVHVWDVNTFQELYTLEGHEGTVYSLAVMAQPSGAPLLFSASYDKSIKVWDLENFECLQSLKRHENSANAIAVQRNWLFSGAADNTVKVWSQD